MALEEGARHRVGGVQKPEEVKGVPDSVIHSSSFEVQPETHG